MGFVLEVKVEDVYFPEINDCELYMLSQDKLEKANTALRDFGFIIVPVPTATTFLATKWKPNASRGGRSWGRIRSDMSELSIGLPLFFSSPKRVGGKRWQREVTTVPPSLEELISKILCVNLPTDKVFVRRLHTLVSMDGCGRQSLHRDMRSGEGCWGDGFFLLSMHDETHIYVVPGSHQQPNERNWPYTKKITIGKHCMLLAHRHLVHAGADDSCPPRIHGYTTLGHRISQLPEGYVRPDIESVGEMGHVAPFFPVFDNR